MELSISHATCYDYLPPVDVAHHIACLQPMQTVTQTVLTHALSVTPKPAQSSASVDVFGNQRRFFSLQIPHSHLEIVATSTVSTRRLEMQPLAQPWEQVAAYCRYRADGAYDADVAFVFASQHVPQAAEFAAYAQPSFAPGADLHASAVRLMHRIHDEFTYDGLSTEIHTPARDALRQRKGVCQDFAHIMLACLRSLGLPARYVSGYLLTVPPAGSARLVGADASHAWISVLLPGQSGTTRWCDFDPTNDRWGWGAPGDDYVVLAIGRDYADVSPLRGVIHGGASHALKVAVTVSPIVSTGPTLAPTAAAASATSYFPTLPEPP